MKIKKIPIIYLFCINIIFTQEKYLSPDDVKVEWQNYTSFQRQELVNFATFLFDEQFYERALLVFFQFLYKYPGDELEIAAYFNIAKCYEMMDNWDLAENYYNRIIKETPIGSVDSNAAKYQLLYIAFETENYDKIIESTLESKDPYDLVFRAYAHFEMLDWNDSRVAFRSAEAAFDHNYYSKKIKPWYNAINTAENAPLKSKTPALLSSLFPGGGFIYLKQNENAMGTLGASLLTYAAIFSSSLVSQQKTISISSNRQMITPMSSNVITKEGKFHSSGGYSIPNPLKLSTNNRTAIIPPTILAFGIYFGSIWKSVQDIDESNRKLVLRFTGRVTKKLSVETFMDYPIPDFVIK